MRASYFVTALVLMPATCGTAYQDLRGTQTAERLVIRAADPDSSLTDRLAAYGSICNLPTDQRNAALQQLVEQRDETFAAMAAGRLITDRVSTLPNSLNARFAVWSWKSQWAVLGPIQSYGPDPTLWELPRIVLRRSADAGVQFAEGTDAGRVTSLAAVILIRSVDTSDVTLMKNTLAAQPLLSALWLARTKFGHLDPNEAKLAEAIFQSDTSVLPLRNAAAIALSPVNRAAAQFASRTIREFLLRYSNIQAEQMIAEAYRISNSGSDPTGRNILAGFQLKLLGGLQYLREDDAEALTFEFIAAKNEFIRKTLGIVAAIRWPRRLLRDDRSVLPEVEYTNLLAVSKLFHPLLEMSSYSRGLGDSVRSAHARLQRVGLDGVFLNNAPAAFGL